MSNVKLTINGQEIEVKAGTTILDAARSADIYIPTLCHHPDLPPAGSILAARVIYQGDRRIENTRAGEPAQGCGLCVVEVEGEGEFVGSCVTEVHDGMAVVTESDRITARRQENLTSVLVRHRHACLTCAQQEGCSRSQCSSNVPENERCCDRFGHCELQDVVNYIGISRSTPRWIPTDLPVFDKDPLFVRDYNLCIGCTRCVRACSELRGIGAIGFVYDENGQMRIGTVGPTLAESECKFCTACVEVCPTGALMDKSVRPGKKEEDLVPCREVCPAHIDVPGYLRLVARGKREEAHAVIREKVPLPGILGRVCTHPCEDACRRGELNQALSICALKRYASDDEKGLWKSRSRTEKDSGKKVAVVGSGPAGLTAAFYLKKQGHSVTIFEAREKAGGMMRYGIPAFRLPAHILDKELGDILDFGMEFLPGKTLGKDFTLEGLRENGYDAVFLGVGAQLCRRISLEGSEIPGVFWGVDFLRHIAEGEEIHLGEEVVVIGGGNVAVDVARTAVRCGAEEVTMVCIEKREEMPAREWQTKRAEEEGVVIMPSWGPDRILSDNGAVSGIELVKCVSVFDDRGNFEPTFDATEKQVVGGQVIIAVGQASDLAFLNDVSTISVERGLIVVDRDSLETGLQGVFAGGDVTSAQGSIIYAIAAGRKAASAIDRQLGGTGDIGGVLFEQGDPDQYIGREEGFASRPREKMPMLEPKARGSGFEEVALGLTDEQALKEAGRCLQCDLRLFMKSNPSPPEKRVVFSEVNILRVPESEGVYKLFDGDRNVLVIKGTANLREGLLEELRKNTNAAYFKAEEAKMYSQRECELIQKHLQEHGEMPGGGASDLDELF